MSKEDHYLKGMELFGDDDLEGAVQELHKALEEDPSYGDALHAIAMCYYHKKDFPNAVTYGEKLKEVEPENPLAYTSLSMFYNARGMIAKAEEMGGQAQEAGHTKPSSDDSTS